MIISSGFGFIMAIGTYWLFDLHVSSTPHVKLRSWSQQRGSRGKQRVEIMDVMPTEMKVRSTMRIASELPFTEGVPVQPDIDMLTSALSGRTSSAVVA